MKKDEKHQPSHHATQTTVIKTGGGFFSGLFQGAGGIIGCCIGAIIIFVIILAIASSWNEIAKMGMSPNTR